MVQRDGRFERVRVDVSGGGVLPDLDKKAVAGSFLEVEARLVEWKTLGFEFSTEWVLSLERCIAWSMSAGSRTKVTSR